MKIIGITKTEGAYPSDAYIAIVSHDEIKAVMDKASYSNAEKLPPFKVGDLVDLSAGHNFRKDIAEATRKMADAYTAFAKVAPVAAEFAGVVARKSSEGQA